MLGYTIRTVNGPRLSWPWPFQTRPARPTKSGHSSKAPQAKWDMHMPPPFITNSCRRFRVAGVDGRSDS